MSEIEIFSPNVDLPISSHAGGEAGEDETRTSVQLRLSSFGYGMQRGNGSGVEFSMLQHGGDSRKKMIPSASFVSDRLPCCLDRCGPASDLVHNRGP